jgi:hypothetical protein
LLERPKRAAEGVEARFNAVSTRRDDKMKMYMKSSRPIIILNTEHSHKPPVDVVPSLDVFRRASYRMVKYLAIPKNS